MSSFDSCRENVPIHAKNGRLLRFKDGIKILPLALGLILCSVGRLGAEKVLQETFEAPNALVSWHNNGAGKGEIVGTQGGSQGLCVSTDTQSDHLVRFNLPVAQVRGRRVSISARVRAKAVVKAPELWHGVKVMLQVVSPEGSKYEGVPNLFGTFDWKVVGTSALVPLDATEVVVFLGLGQASGTAWFDDVEISVSGAYRVRPLSQPKLSAPEDLDRRSDIPRLRGVMYGPRAKKEDLRTLASWKANLIRWQLYWHDGNFPEKRLDLANYDRWLDETVTEIDHMLPLCRELGLRLVIDLHTPPGGTDSGQMSIFQNKECQKKFIEAWDKLAKHFQNEPAVWGYDLLNEPAEGKVASGLMDWRTLAEFVARRVRDVDARHAIIIEPGAHGGWSNLPFFPPLDVPGVIYSVHMYDPLRFTHQGVLEGMDSGVTYPGEIEGKFWDREALRRLLEPVREYQKDYNVPIFIGEFSAPRWAPGDSAAVYLRDCITIFEEYGWDWAYHSFREWHGWNVELGPDPHDDRPVKTPSNRQQALREGLERNLPSGP